MNIAVTTNSIKNNRPTHATVGAALSSASSLHTGEHVTPVYLNLYDLGGCTNACVHSIGLSFYHCAVQTHSAEYGYMGHPYKFTGLYKTSKHDSRFNLYRLRDSMEVGWTWFSEKQIDKILTDLQPFYLGYDYHTINKNSIHFAKYLLEQLSNDQELKHLEPIKILKFPSYIDRGRRLCHTFEFLQMFDTEKEIAEINILYFLYMKYEGNLEQICQILKCDTIDKLKRCIQLIEQGIRQKKLPIFSAFTTFDMKTAYNCLHINDQSNPDIDSNYERLTLTDIFHQFDTITLRGRTSIDRYLNIQRAKELAQHAHIENEQQPMTTINMIVDRKSLPFDGQRELDSSPQISGRSEAVTIPEINGHIKQTIPTQKYHSSSVKYDIDHTTLSHVHRSSFPQAISQNQGRTPLTSPPGSNISGLALTSTHKSSSPPVHSTSIIETTPIFIDPLLKFEHLHMRTAVPVGTVLRLQELPNPNLPLTELHLTTDGDHSPLSLVANRQRKIHSSHKRKLPRDFELNSDLYTITNQNSLRHNYTNNAISTVHSSSQFQQPTIDIISFQKVKTGEDTDSSV